VGYFSQKILLFPHKILELVTACLTLLPKMILLNISQLRFALVIFVVALESIHAADQQAKLQLRRCVSLTSNMNSREQLQNFISTVRSCAYLPAHSAVTPQPECTRPRHLIDNESVRQEQPHRETQEFTRIQTRLFPKIRF
jgi:hypothetical protein